jgi:hypothetical protein
MPIPYPNANYPKAYDEADMLKATDVPVNATGTGLTVADVTAGSGPLMETVTGEDVEGTGLRGDNVEPVAAE